MSDIPKTIYVDASDLMFRLEQLAGSGLGIQVGEQIGFGIAKALKEQFPFLVPKIDPPGSGSEAEYMDSVRHL